MRCGVQSAPQKKYFVQISGVSYIINTLAKQPRPQQRDNQNQEEKAESRDQMHDNE